MSFAIAIDGPAASGKSTIARKLAEELCYNFINSGGMYRSVAWAAWKREVDVKDPERVCELVDSLDLQCGMVDRHSTVTVDGVDPGEELTHEEVNFRVSHIAKVAEVREILVQKQREYLNLGPLVMEGRDIGSVVFPETPYKIYIDASAQVRAQRRQGEGGADAILLRDQQDSQREISPLKVADGATVIDSSDMDVSQTLEAVLDVLRTQGLPTLIENS